VVYETRTVGQDSGLELVHPIDTIRHATRAIASRDRTNNPDQVEIVQIDAPCPYT
jgi:hypothetical protein